MDTLIFQLAAVTVGSVMLGIEFGATIGVSAALFGYAIIPLSK